MPLLILLLMVFCGILFVRVNKLENTIADLQEFIEENTLADNLGNTSVGNDKDDFSDNGDGVDLIIINGESEGESLFSETAQGNNSDSADKSDSLDKTDNMDNEDNTDDQNVKETDDDVISEDIETEDELQQEVTEVSGNDFSEESKTSEEVESEQEEETENNTDESELLETADVSWSDKTVYLTFDDGPSSNTSEILEILDNYDVKATFFTVGKTSTEEEKLYRQIIAKGHTLGMHSYSHEYKKIYASEAAFKEDFLKIKEHIFDVTGIETDLYRFPGGSSNTVSDVDMEKLADYLTEQGITYFDWNVSAEDAKKGNLTVDEIVENVIAGCAKKDICMVLLHDSEKLDNTVEALPIIIEQLQERGATILPITEKTEPIQHTMD